MMKKKYFIIFMVLFTLSANFLAVKFRKEILFFLYILTESPNEQNLCVQEKGSISIYGCERNPIQSIFLFHGWSPAGGHHKDLKKLISALTRSNSSVRIFVPNLASLTSPEWNFEKTQKELLALNNILSEYKINHYKIISICGSTQPMMHLFLQGSFNTEPDMIFLWNPYFSLESLLREYKRSEWENGKTDIYIKSIIYFNTTSPTEEEKEKLLLFFKHSKPGKTSKEDAAKYLENLFPVVENYSLPEKAIFSLDKYRLPEMKKTNTKFVLSCSNDGFIPKSECIKLADFLRTKDNKVEIFSSGEEHSLKTQIMQTLRIFRMLLE